MDNELRVRDGFVLRTVAASRRSRTRSRALMREGSR